MKKTFTLAMTSLALCTTTGISLAANAPDDQWQFGVTVPVWAPGIDGDVTVRGRTADVDLGFDDLADHLDASFSLGLEARKGKFGLYTGVGYMKFSADGKGPRGAKGDAELKFLVADMGMSYQLVHTGGERPFVLEATAGLRYWAVETDLKLTGPEGNVLVDKDDKTELFDPVFGLRGSQYLSPKWHVDFQGDIGGFNMYDNASDLTWSATGLLSYDAARWLTLSAGYKALSLDVSNGSGSNESGADIVMHGLLLTAKFKF